MPPLLPESPDNSFRFTTHMALRGSWTNREDIARAELAACFWTDVGSFFNRLRKEHGQVIEELVIDVKTLPDWLVALKPQAIGAISLNQGVPHV